MDGISVTFNKKDISTSFSSLPAEGFGSNTAVKAEKGRHFCF